jgi:hypothetical protein
MTCYKTHTVPAVKPVSGGPAKKGSLVGQGVAEIWLLVGPLRAKAPITV